VIKFIDFFPKTLTYLNLDGCTKITNASLLLISKRCPDLRYLKLKGCYKVNDVRDILKNCVYLEELNLSKLRQAVNKEFFGTINQYRYNLNSLNLVDCPVTDNELRILADAIGPKLKSLIIKFCYDITSEGIRYLCLHCINLKILDIQALQVDDSIFPDLIHCTQLTLVDFRDCNLISHGLITWLKTRPLLEEIRLRNSNINDDIVEHLAYCRNIQLIDLQSCKQVTESSIMYLLGSSLPLLRFCNLTVIPTFSEEVKEKILRMAKFQVRFT